MHYNTTSFTVKAGVRVCGRGVFVSFYIYIYVCIKIAFGHGTGIPGAFIQIDVTNIDPQ